jgi:Ran GTPase-activating protein (RanGAP) involved in mRNA processing and transport
MISRLNVIKIYQLVQKLLGRGHTDRQTGDLTSLTFLFKESRLKITKNCMRTTMGQERLPNLAMLSIESKLCENLYFSDLINSFTEPNVRKIDFV